MIRTISLILIIAIGFACSGKSRKTKENQPKNQTAVSFDKKTIDSAYFASGCFWCVEAIYENVKGVKEAVSGYAGGSKKNPGYKEVARGNTNHAETVKVYYDTTVIDFKTLVKVYYGSQNPTTEGQDPDFGPQYRSIIFYSDKSEERIAQNFKDSLASSGSYNDPIVTEIKPLKAFWQASEYHQDYEEKHPNKPYIQQVSKPRFQRFKNRYPHLIKDNGH